MTTIGELLGHITIGSNWSTSSGVGWSPTRNFPLTRPPSRARDGARTPPASHRIAPRPEGVRRAGHAAHAERGCCITSTTSTRNLEMLAQPTPRRRRPAGHLRLSPPARRPRRRAAAEMGGEGEQPRREGRVRRLTTAATRSARNIKSLRVNSRRLRRAGPAFG